MKKNGNFYQNLLNHFQEGIFFINPKNQLTFWSQGAKMISGYSLEEIKKILPLDLFIRPDNPNDPDFNQSLLALEFEGEVEALLKNKEGHLIPVVVKSTPIRGNRGELHGTLKVFRNNSSYLIMRAKMEKLEKVALLDPYLGLPNRRYLEKIYPAAIERTKRYGWQLGILFIKIANFSTLLEKRGATFGSETIKNLHRTFQGNLRPFDSVGLWEKDEFVALIENIPTRKLISIAEKFRFFAEHSFTSTLENTLLTVSILAQIADPKKSLPNMVQTAKTKLEKNGFPDGNSGVEFLANPS